MSLTRGIKTGRTPTRARSPTRSTEGDKPEKAEKDSREREAEKAETPSLIHPVLFRHLPLSDASCGGLFKRRAFLLFYFRFHAGVSILSPESSSPVVCERNAGLDGGGEEESRERRETDDG